MFRHPANTNPLAAVKSEQPDKVLFDAAMGDLDKGKYTVARLDLETLLNTYPDSEYLARAKMGIADSWYRQGGIDGMAQAEAQYKDFITFFPAMKEASEAQLKVATIHYKQLEKPDRDPTEANRAQAALRTFLLNYPDSPLRKQAVQMLRETQEVLAEREYRIGDFYLERAIQGEYPDYRPAQSRLEELLNRYPLYSKGDVVTDELANSYLTTARLYQGAAKIEVATQSQALFKANADADQAKAVADFDRLIERYPLSPLAQDADKELAALKQPVPKPSQEAIAFNRQEIAGRNTAVSHQGMLAKLDLNALVSTHPSTEIARADKVGVPSFSEPIPPPSDPPPGLDALVHATMVATGAIPAGPPNASLSARLTGAGAATSGNGSQAAGQVAGSVLQNSPGSAAPLAFQNVPDKPRGADTPESSTPQAVSGNNDNDPNAQQATVSDNPNVLLTPNEIDIENREQIMASDVHRDVPAPYRALVKAARTAAELRAKQMEKLKKPLPPKPGAAPAGSKPPAAPAASVPPTKKSSFFHFWP
ncbi:MAG: outer membrane protein assembly factor BamD, partial [Terriglobales bacterium]